MIVLLKAQLGWVLFLGLQQQAALPVVLRYHGNCHFINRQIATQDPELSCCPELLKLYKFQSALGFSLSLPDVSNCNSSDLKEDSPTVTLAEVTVSVTVK